MKITYSKGYTPDPTLNSLKVGEVFRPINSQRIYMKTAYKGVDDIFSNTAYEDYIENIQSFDFDDCPPIPKELCACIDLTDGTIVLFHLDITVKMLKCELNIIEEAE